MSGELRHECDNRSLSILKRRKYTTVQLTNGSDFMAVVIYY